MILPKQFSGDMLGFDWLILNQRLSSAHPRCPRQSRSVSGLPINLGPWL